LPSRFVRRFRPNQRLALSIMGFRACYCSIRLTDEFVVSARIG
jgi:hypothetical protein